MGVSSFGFPGGLRRLGSKLFKLSAKLDDDKTGLALVSANFGGIDNIKIFPRTPGVDTYFYTDPDGYSDSDPAAITSWGRVIVPDYPRHDFGPRLRGRYFKHQIHRLPEMARYRWLVWADASLQFHDASFLLHGTERLATLPPHKRVALLLHPERNTVRKEYEFIRKAIDSGSEYLHLRYAQEKMTEQMDFFKSSGWNLDAPLYCGTIWLIENNDLVARCWDSWWDQNLRYGLMDQLSLPVLLDAFGIEPFAVDLNVYRNSFFEMIEHRKLM